MPPVFVSLTTTRSRLPLCAHTVWSLLQQECQPTKIIVWVSSEPYLLDEGITEEPDWAKNFNNLYGIIEFKWTQNTGPYRKLFPTLQLADQETIIVYADDDAIYQKKWLKTLLHKFIESNQEKAVAARVRRKTRNVFGFYVSYMLMPLVSKEEILARDFIATGLGGVVLKRSFIKESLLENQDFLKICPTTDDLWISEILERSHTSLIACPEALPEVIDISPEEGLCKTNNLFSTSIPFRIINKIKTHTLGWLGTRLCKNDNNLRAIKAYFSNISL